MVLSILVNDFIRLYHFFEEIWIIFSNILLIISNVYFCILESVNPHVNNVINFYPVTSNYTSSMQRWFLPFELLLQKSVDSHSFVPTNAFTSSSRRRREELREECRVLRQEILELKVLSVNQNPPWELYGHCKSHDELVTDTTSK